MKWSIRKFFSRIKAEILRTEGKKQGVKINVREDENEYTATVQLKGNDLTLPRSMNDPKQIISAIKFEQGEQIYNEPPDDVSTEKLVKAKPLEELPEIYSRAIYPATTRPNITSIKDWVVNVKLSGKSNQDILEEMYGRDDPIEMAYTDNFYNAFDRMVDSIAYKISRKIWYVGRRPSNMTDSQWNDLTRYMRPPEGSYGKGDVWKVFKYDFDYEYVSGVIE